VKVLACVPHFFNRSRAYESGLHGSSVDSPQVRFETTRYCLRHLQALLADSEYDLTTSASSRVGFDTLQALPKAITGDICLCVCRDDDFKAELTSGLVLRVLRNDGDPRLLGYACRRAFARNVDRYDLYCFIEDDTAILDPQFFEKIAFFHRRFGEDKVLLPSRFELAGEREAAWKTYTDDGAFGRMQIEPPAGAPPRLELTSWNGAIELVPTRSPYSGCYVVTNSQLRAWMALPDFLEPDPAMLATTGILEVAQVPLGGRLPTYKPAKRNANFLEVHHVPNRLCNGQAPLGLMRQATRAEVDRRIAAEIVLSDAEPPGGKAD
jgi:hypothetical protein